MSGINVINNKKTFEIDKEQVVELLQYEELSDHFRKEFEPYLLKRIYLCGDVTVKQKRGSVRILLKNVKISDNLNSFAVLGESDHIWIKCDSDIASTIAIGDRCFFRGMLYPYIDIKGELNIGFNVSGKVLKCKEPLNDKRKDLLDAYSLSNNEF